MLLQLRFPRLEHLSRIHFYKCHCAAFVPAFAADIRLKTSLPPGDIPFNTWNTVSCQPAYKLSTAPRPATSAKYHTPNAHSWTKAEERVQGHAKPRKTAKGVMVPGPIMWTHTEQRHQWHRRIETEDREAYLAEYQTSSRDAAPPSNYRSSAPGIASDLVPSSPMAEVKQKLAFRAATARLLTGEGGGRWLSRSSTPLSFSAAASPIGGSSSAAASPFEAAVASNPADTAPRPLTTSSAVLPRTKAPLLQTAKSFSFEHASSSAAAAPPPNLTLSQAHSLAVAPLLGGGTQEDLKPRPLVNQTKRLMDSPGNRPGLDSGAMQRIIFPNSSKLQSSDSNSTTNTSRGGGGSPAVLPAHLAALTKDVIRRRLQRQDATDQNNALAEALAAQKASTASANRAWNQSMANNAGDAFTAKSSSAALVEGSSQATIGVRSRATLTSEQINERPARSLRQIWF